MEWHGCIGCDCFCGCIFLHIRIKRYGDDQENDSNEVRDYFTEYYRKGEVINLAFFIYKKLIKLKNNFI